MTYQQCRYEGTVEKIPIQEIDGQLYVLLNDVHGPFPHVTYFKYNNEPIHFERDSNHERLNPNRIKANTEVIIDCYKPINDDKTTSKFDGDMRQQVSEIHQHSKKALEDLEILKANTNAILRQTFELAEYITPRLFIILPDYTPHYNVSQWFQLNYRLYFLCECEHNDERHFAHHKGYKIKRTREFFRKYGSHLSDMLKVVKFTKSVSRLFVPRLSQVASGISTLVTQNDRFPLDNLDMRLEWLDQCLKEAEKSLNVSVDRKIQPLEGAALREIVSFLKQTDEHCKFGNLIRSVTNEGHVRWLCIEHHQKQYSKDAIRNLHEEFRKLGGEIREDIAFIEGKASEKFLGMLEILKKGLSLFTVVLKDLHAKEEHFDDLLNFLSGQSKIRNLQLENFTILSNYFIKKRTIISKLDETLRKNDKLQIQYSFIKPLTKLAAKTVHAITKAHSRLIFQFQLRSQENSPSLELFGSKDTGFTLKINNSDEKNDTNYHTVIRIIFSQLPNITKILLHKGVISENIWISFRDYLTKNDCLKELTIDCRLTREQTELLYHTLSDSKALKILHILDDWESEDDLVGCKNIFNMVEKNNSLIEFSFKSSSSLLQVDFDEFNVQPNESHRSSCYVKCKIHQMTNVELFENFLQNFSIHKASLELINFHSESSIRKLIYKIDKNINIKILELKDSDCFAIYHRQEDYIPSSETSLTSSSLSSARPESTTCFEWFTCHRCQHCNHLCEKTVLQPVGSTRENRSKSVSLEQLDQSCDDHPPLYKKVQTMMQNLELNELEVTIEALVKMISLGSSIESNRTLLRLGISIRKATVEDLRILIEALRKNSTITHLTLHEIEISIDHFRPIFDILRTDRTLRVVKIEYHSSYSDHDQFIKEVKELEIINPSLKIIYENSCNNS